MSLFVQPGGWTNDDKLPGACWVARSRSPPSALYSVCFNCPASPFHRGYLPCKLVQLPKRRGRESLVPIFPVGDRHHPGECWHMVASAATVDTRLGNLGHAARLFRLSPPSNAVLWQAGGPLPRRSSFPGLSRPFEGPHFAT